MTYGIGTNPEHWVKLPGAGVEVRGTNYPVYADARGTLGAVMGGTEYVGSSMDTLRTYMMAASRRQQVKVSVPFSKLITGTYDPERATVQHGVATGIHASSGNVLIRWQDGKTEQASGYSGYMQPLSQDESSEYIRLHQAKAAANKALSQFEEAHELRSGKNGQSKGLPNAVRAAIETAQKELGEKEAKASG